MKLLIIVLLLNVTNYGQLLMPGVGPLKPGNTWIYKERDDPTDFLYYKVTDTVLTTDSIKYFKIIRSEKFLDYSALYIGESSDSFLTRKDYESTPYKFYKMNCKWGDSWVSVLYPYPGGLINTFYYTVTDTGDIYWYYFGRTITLKRIMITDNELVHLQQFWNDTLGLFAEISEEGYTYELRGCVINGIAYGDTNKPTVIRDKENLTSDFHLFQNYPNPFNPSTRISYYLPKAGMVDISVSNILGEEVTELLDGYQNKGMHEVIFDGRNLSSGVYFYAIRAGNLYQVKKMILQK